MPCYLPRPTPEGHAAVLMPGVITNCLPHCRYHHICTCRPGTRTALRGPHNRSMSMPCHRRKFTIPHIAGLPAGLPHATTGGRCSLVDTGSHHFMPCPHASGRNACRLPITFPPTSSCKDSMPATLTSYSPRVSPPTVTTCNTIVLVTWLKCHYPCPFLVHSEPSLGGLFACMGGPYYIPCLLQAYATITPVYIPFSPICPSSSSSRLGSPASCRVLSIAWEHWLGLPLPYLPGYCPPVTHPLLRAERKAYRRLLGPCKPLLCLPFTLPCPTWVGVFPLPYHFTLLTWSRCLQRLPTCHTFAPPRGWPACCHSSVAL